VADVLEIKCPDCGSTLRVDAETGLVLHHKAAPPKHGVNLDDAQNHLRRQDAERDRRFQQSVEAEKKRDDLLARKFEQSLRRAKDNPDEPRPLRDFDLD